MARKFRLGRFMSRALIVGAVLGAGLVAGGMLIQSGAWRQADASPATIRLLDQVVARVSRDYIDTISTDELYRRAAFGAVKEIDDPYSVLLTPQRAGRLRDTTSGRPARGEGGVGVDIDMRDGFVTVIAPLADTPADSAGIQAGDRVMSINDKPTYGLSLDEVHQALRGPVGSAVRLTIERGDEHPTFKLLRRAIVFHPVQRSEMLSGSIGYVVLATFSEQAAREVRRAVDALRARGAQSLILDLRENPGGALEQGIAVGDLFFDPPQTIARTRGRTGDANRDFSDQAPQPWPAMPIVALVDSGTASAAEIVAGALQDNDRAVLVGSPTYGKGSAQRLLPVGEGHVLKLTTARWVTPAGRVIERDSTQGGITPDVVVRQPEGLAPRNQASLLTDPVVARAMQLLTGVSTPSALRARAPKRR